MAMIKNKKITTILLLITVIVIASFFRLWQLKSIPGGLFPDEAANGLDIVNYIFKGHQSPFFERGLGRESLFFYLQALSVKIFGIGHWQMHFVSAIIGILTVILTWFFAKKLFNTRVAFAASFLMATSSWHVTLSRTGFRAILVPFFSILFFYLVYLTYKEAPGKKRLVLAALTGIALALGLYTYISFRFVSVIIAFLFGFILLVSWRILKAYFKEIIIVLIFFILVVAPLAVYFVHHPASFMGRSGYVSIFNKDMNQGDLVGTFLYVAKKTFWMFFTDGDLNWRHNTSGFSMLNPIVSPFFSLGFLYCLGIIVFYLIKRKLFRKEFLEKYFKYLFLIAWFILMLGPSILSAESIPHGLRSIGAMPAVFILAAIFIDFLWGKLESLLKIKYISLFLAIFLGLILFNSLIYDYNLYFGISANSPGFYYAYRSDLTTVSNYLNQRNLKEKTYLVLDPYSVQTPEFLTAYYNQPYILVDPATSYKISLKPGDQIVFTQSTIFDTRKFQEYHPEDSLVEQDLNQFNEIIMRVYQY